MDWSCWISKISIDSSSIKLVAIKSRCTFVFLSIKGWCQDMRTMWGGLSCSMGSSTKRLHLEGKCTWVWIGGCYCWN
jgi:hypothetical protein